MTELVLLYPKRNLKGITKADCEARKSDNLLKRDLTSKKPLEKCITDVIEIKAKEENSIFQQSSMVLTQQYWDWQ